jgi:hypothetical protein
MNGQIQLKKLNSRTMCMMITVPLSETWVLYLKRKEAYKYIWSPSRIKFNDLRSKRNRRVLWMKGRGRRTALIREVEIKIFILSLEDNYYS